MIRILNNFGAVPDPVITHIHALPAERGNRKQVFPARFQLPYLVAASELRVIIWVDRHHLQRAIVGFTVGNLDHEARRGINYIEIVQTLEGPFEVKVLVRPTMIVPNDEVAFGQFVVFDGGDVQCHFLLLGGDNLVLDVGVGEHTDFVVVRVVVCCGVFAFASQISPILVISLGFFLHFSLPLQFQFLTHIVKSTSDGLEHLEAASGVLLPVLLRCCLFRLIVVDEVHGAVYFLLQLPLGLGELVDGVVTVSSGSILGFFAIMLRGEISNIIHKFYQEPQVRRQWVYNEQIVLAIIINYGYSIK